MAASMIDTMRKSGQMIPTYVDLPSSRVFTLFFPSTRKDASVLLYNPGGPGGSGITSILYNYSPLILGENGVTQNEGYSNLTSYFHILYIDIPANTGFSIAKRPQQYGDKNTIDDLERIVKVLLKTYKRYVGDNPILDFFGFSYAGKLWPLLAQRLQRGGYRIGGMAIFSGYTDPVRQEIRPLMEYLMYNGLITNSEYDRLEKATDQIEIMINKDPTDTQAQLLYVNTITEAWELASADTYDIKIPSTVDDPLDKPKTEDLSIVLNSPDVMKALGVNVPFYPEATTFTVETYEGFLAPVTDTLKALADSGVFIFYMVGTLDGATLAKGTADMFEHMFGVKLQDYRWIINPADILQGGINTNVLVGKIAEMRPNVYFGTVIGSGHSFDTAEGSLVVSAVLKNLYEKHAIFHVYQ